MPDDNYQDRTLPATPRKRQEAREQGNVAKSPDISSALVLLSSILALYFFGDMLMAALRQVMVSSVGSLHVIEIDPRDIFPTALGGLIVIGKALLPLLAMIGVFALAANLLQVGFLWTTKPFEPDISKLNPIEGIKRIVSLRGFVRLLVSISKILVVTGVMVWTLWGEWDKFLSMLGFELPAIASYMVDMGLLLGLRAALALLILALIDYTYQKWQHEKDLMMSKQEVKEEMKRFEGDPRMKSRRREVQLQIALQRMMQQVPTASVVITNPTHYAVALKYDPENMSAPRIIAKGTDNIALRIRELAQENDVPIWEEPPLARAIFAAAEVGEEIPEKFYKAVAEILAQVFQMQEAVTAA